MSLADEIEKLQKLRSSGVLNAQEFEQAKAALLRGPVAPSPGASAASPQYMNVKHDDRAGFSKGIERGMEKVSSDATAGCMKFAFQLGIAVLIIGAIAIFAATRCQECKGTGKCTSSFCVGGRTMLLSECSTCNGTAKCPKCKGAGW